MAGPVHDVPFAVPVDCGTGVQTLRLVPVRVPVAAYWQVVLVEVGPPGSFHPQGLTAVVVGVASQAQATLLPDQSTPTALAD